MIKVLSTSRLLFDEGPAQLVDLASRYEFDAVDAVPAYFEDDAVREDFVGRVSASRLGWGLAGLPVTIGTTTTPAEFDALLIRIGKLCPRLADSGVTTMSTWLAPANDDAPYVETMRLHLDRLNRLSPLLAGHGLRLALEYVGPKTWRDGKQYSFVATLAGMRSLIAQLDDPARFGLLIDTFHWHTAGESADDIADLRADEVLAVDLNDAPAGRDVADQLDMERAQPGATGVIDIAGFLEALRSTGYDGLVQSEPFSTELLSQPYEKRVADARAALSATLGEDQFGGS